MANRLTAGAGRPLIEKIGRNIAPGDGRARPTGLWRNWLSCAATFEKLSADMRLHALYAIGCLVLSGIAVFADGGNESLREAGAIETTLENQRVAAGKLIHAATETNFAHRRLSELCDTFGPRFSGTTNLEAAIDWVLAQMKADGLENVHGEEVMVPRWVRGEESLELREPVREPLLMLGLGGSVGTDGKYIEAPVLVVTSFDELYRRRNEARGRIVVFNAPFVDYGQTVAYRWAGAIEAAKAGAFASLTRSVTPFSLRTPHTGMMTYSNGVPEIPHAAITVEDAEQLQRWQDRGTSIVARLKMSARFLEDALSRNVVAEIAGREKPREIVLISGHLDSWDVGQGAQDDGGGCLAAWEAVRLMHQLGLRPRRTVRVVLWTNEENGLRGAKAYAEKHRGELDRHVLAIESDNGTYPPTGFAFSGSDQGISFVKRVGELLDPLHAGNVKPGGGGADVEQLSPSGVPVMELTVENPKYFWFHHTVADTVDKVNPRDLAQCAAALAVMAYMIADLPEPLPR
jgi:carboxypeptidase Q